VLKWKSQLNAWANVEPVSGTSPKSIRFMRAVAFCVSGCCIVIIFSNVAKLQSHERRFFVYDVSNTAIDEQRKSLNILITKNYPPIECGGYYLISKVYLFEGSGKVFQNSLLETAEIS
jgi:hypothetical protein